MSQDSMLMCLIFFVLGFLVSRMMRGNGLSVGCRSIMERDGRAVSCKDGSSMFTPCDDFYEQSFEQGKSVRYKCKAHGAFVGCERGDPM